MHPGLDQPAARSVGTWFLLLVAITASLLGGFILLATALGFGHADVRGVPLEGGFELLFLAGLGVAVALAGAAAVGFVRRRRWAVGLLAAAWPSFALVCLVLDRIAPAPGPGRPLAFYILGIGLLPAAITLLLGRVGGQSRRAERTHLQPHREG
jgi:hypothetical protein